MLSMVSHKLVPATLMTKSTFPTFLKTPKMSLCEEISQVKCSTPFKEHFVLEAQKTLAPDFKN